MTFQRTQISAKEQTFLSNALPKYFSTHLISPQKLTRQHYYVILKNNILAKPKWGPWGWTRMQNVCSVRNPMRERIYVCSITRWISHQGLTGLQLFLSLHWPKCACTDMHFGILHIWQLNTTQIFRPSHQHLAMSGLSFFFLTTHIWKTRQKEMVPDM